MNSNRIEKLVTSYTGPESIGFVRLHYIPRRWLIAAANADALQGGDVLTFRARLKLFLSGLSVADFSIWLKSNGIK